MMRRNILVLLAVVSAIVLVSFNTTALFALEVTGGIGMEVYQLYNHMSKDHRGNIVVINVFEDSPAEKNGIKIGDVILEIDGTRTWKRDFKDLLNNKLRGPANTEVKMKIFRPSTKQIINVSLTRVPMGY